MLGGVEMVKGPLLRCTPTARAGGTLENKTAIPLPCL